MKSLADLGMLVDVMESLGPVARRTLRAKLRGSRATSS
jgi:hypothetical protein